MTMKNKTMDFCVRAAACGAVGQLNAYTIAKYSWLSGYVIIIVREWNSEKLDRDGIFFVLFAILIV